MKEFDFERYERNLPDAYAKNEGSNLVKLLRLKAAAMNALRKDISDVLDSFDVDNLTGKSLDLLGKDIGQARGLATDEQYRVMIKAKQARDVCNGDLNSVITALALTFDCEPSEIKIRDGSADRTVVVESIPLGVLTKAGFTSEQAVAIIKSVMPAGTLLECNFEGTFELCDTEADMNVDGSIKGLTDTEEHLDFNVSGVGGYLGLFINGSEELPN